MSESSDIPAWFGATGAREDELRRVDELVGAPWSTGDAAAATAAGANGYAT